MRLSARWLRRRWFGLRLRGVLRGLAITRCNGDDSNACDGGVDACAEVAPTPLAVECDARRNLGEARRRTECSPIALTRGPGGDGDVAVTIENDAGATEVADPLTIPAASQTGTLVVHIHRRAAKAPSSHDRCADFDDARASVAARCT